jgi:hypothetical protein
MFTFVLDTIICKYCSQNFSTIKLDIVLNHTKACDLMVRPRKDYTYMCLKCDYHTHNNQRMERHIRSHSGYKPYECSFCDHRSKRKDHLLMHIRVKHDQ